MKQIKAKMKTKEKKKYNNSNNRQTFFDMYLIKNYTCYRIAIWSSFASIDTHSTWMCDVCLIFFILLRAHLIATLGVFHFGAIASKIESKNKSRKEKKKER